ncbi:MAG TPA: aminoglycoside phosphotransferase family protein [Gemmatimonadales bacterium]|jgi:aminoglycoside phosphotransferase (APT) family kinase protein
MNETAFVSAALRVAGGQGVFGSGGKDSALLAAWSAHPLTERAHNRVVQYDLLAADGTELRCVGKFYEHEESAVRAARVLRALSAAGGVVSPRALAYDAWRRLLLVTHEAGEPLTPALGADDGPVASAVARALAALHAIPPTVIADRVIRAATVWNELRFRVAELQTSLPGSTGPLRGRLAELRRDLPFDPPVLSFVHGDFGPANLLWNGRDVVVLDFDRCALGDPALDLGTLFTQLRRSALRAPARVPNFAALRERVLDAYGRADPELDRRVAWYEGAVLIRKIHRLALDTTRHTRPDRIRQRRAEAVRLLEESHAPSG